MLAFTEADRIGTVLGVASGDLTAFIVVAAPLVGAPHPVQGGLLP
jgi:hypothetical protein